MSNQIARDVETCTNSQSSAKLNEKARFSDSLRELSDLHIQITSEIGQISSLQDHTEQVMRANLDRISRLQYSVRKNRKKAKEISDACSIMAEKLLIS